LRVGGAHDSDGGSPEGALAHLFSLSEGDLLDDGRLIETGARGGSTSVLDEKDLIPRG
jgi:hypothetical protein